MKSLFFSYDMTVDHAYIIRINGNKNSMEQAAECAESCKQVGQSYQYWDAYDGTMDKIVPPVTHGQFMSLIKITDHYLTRGEVACALSHISLWLKSVELDKPIVILEHDSIMTKAYPVHSVYNSICFLGSNEQVEQGWGVFPTPPHASEGINYHFICRAHAYAIDPAVAKNLLAHVLKYGICAPLDIMIRADIFPIHQMGIFAYDKKKSTTTISNRPLEGRSTIRNDNLTV